MTKARKWMTTLGKFNSYGDGRNMSNLEYVLDSNGEQSYGGSVRYSPDKKELRCNAGSILVGMSNVEGYHTCVLIDHEATMMSGDASRLYRYGCLALDTTKSPARVYVVPHIDDCSTGVRLKENEAHMWSTVMDMLLFVRSKRGVDGTAFALNHAEGTYQRYVSFCGNFGVDPRERVLPAPHLPGQVLVAKGTPFMQVNLGSDLGVDWFNLRTGMRSKVGGTLFVRSAYYRFKKSISYHPKGLGGAVEKAPPEADLTPVRDMDLEPGAAVTLMGGVGCFVVETCQGEDGSPGELRLITLDGNRWADLPIREVGSATVGVHVGRLVK